MTDNDNDRIDDRSKPIPIHSGEITHEDYWFIQAVGTEWTYVIKKLIEQHLAKIDIKEKPVVLGMTMEQVPIYMLKKKFLPAEAIASATGIALDVIHKEPTLKLSVSAKEGLPEPTVEYWGTA